MRLKLLLICIGVFLSKYVISQITYYKDIAPIIQNKCASCHHAEGNAPFSLLTYEDVSKRNSFIQKVINERIMPPWKADPHYVSFGNERILSDSEIHLINAWVNAKAPAGNINDFKNKKQFITGSHFTRKPDLVLNMSHPYIVRGDNSEQFVVFRMPYKLLKDKNIEAVEFFSNNNKLIHHANFGFHQTDGLPVDKSNDPTYVDLINDAAAYKSYDVLSKKLIYYTGWIPGATYEKYPEKFGWTLPKDGMVLLYMHYAPTAKESESICGVNLFFTEKTIERPITALNIGTGGRGDITPALIIPADSVFRTYASIVTKKAESLLFVWPHMHLLGKSFKAYAITSKNDTIPLIDIPNWDFSWQDIYMFKKIVKIPAYSSINIEAVYDNTRQNPRNPFNPPRIITSDQNLLMKTTDEMLNLLLIYVPYEPGDENISLEK